MPDFKLKWTPEDPSNFLLLTYHARWHDAILTGSFSVEFRKSGPLKLEPEIVYTYVATPVRAITARLYVKSWGFVALDEAAAIAERSLLTEDELRKYAANKKQLYFYEFDRVELAKQPISYDTLSTRYHYFPSSNFFPLSKSGEKTLGDLGHFGAASKLD